MIGTYTCYCLKQSFKKSDNKISVRLWFVGLFDLQHHCATSVDHKEILCVRACQRNQSMRRRGLVCLCFVCMCIGHQGDEGSYVSWGSSACPCVKEVQGSPLLPVRVERKITLLAHNLHLYQVDHIHSLTLTHTLSASTHVNDVSICLAGDSLHQTRVSVCSGHGAGLSVCVGHRRADGGGGRLRGDRWQESIELWHHLSTAPGPIMCIHSYNKMLCRQVYTDSVNVMNEDQLFWGRIKMFLLWCQILRTCHKH